MGRPFMRTPTRARLAANCRTAWTPRGHGALMHGTPFDPSGAQDLASSQHTTLFGGRPRWNPGPRGSSVAGDLSVLLNVSPSQLPRPGPPRLCDACLALLQLLHIVRQEISDERQDVSPPSCELLAELDQRVVR